MASLTPIEIPARVKDITGERYGKLTVLRYAGPKPPSGSLWMCRCDCGNVSFHEKRQLRTGKAKSCGCFRRKSTSERQGHGYAAQTTPSVEPGSYGSYSSMITRCYNQKSTKYHCYGGRGVQVCNRWRFGEFGRSGLECFVLDMKPKPSAELSIDRIDVDGHYEPGNCRWATAKLQRANQRPR